MLNKAQVLERLSHSRGDPQSTWCGSQLGDLDFRDHIFDYKVDFSGAVFAGVPDFSGAVFEQSTTFDSAAFRKPAFFRTCRFEKGAEFSLATFGEANFFQTKFSERATFWKASFGEKADFSQIKVLQPGLRSSDCDAQINFSWSCFGGDAIFTYAEIEVPAYFHRTLFKGDVYLDQCRFGDAVYLHGKQTDVLFPRFGVIDPITVHNLELSGIFRPDAERHRHYQNQTVSEFVCFNNILSQADLLQKLQSLAGAASDEEITAICAGWRGGSLKMFADGHLVSFRGTKFNDLEKVSCRYMDLDKVEVDRQIAGSPLDQRAFADRLKEGSHDVFISHASEDMADLVRPLAQKLREMGFVVWFDESRIETGDKLAERLEAGMLRSRCGIIVLSKAFISTSKIWTRREAEYLLRASHGSGRKLLFLWHGVNETEIKEWSEECAKYVGLDTSKYKLDELALRLAHSIH